MIALDDDNCGPAIAGDYSTNDREYDKFIGVNELFQVTTFPVIGFYYGFNGLFIAAAVKIKRFMWQHKMGIHKPG